MKNKRLTGLSLFAGAGIGETYLSQAGIDIIAANELVPRRADLHNQIYPDCSMICGDITNRDIFEKIISTCNSKIDFIIASPPCQGMSVAGKNRKQSEMQNDERNYLFTHVVNAIKRLSPDYVLIENVPMLLKVKIKYAGKLRSIEDILNLEFGEDYEIKGEVFDSADYGVPQTRLRAIIKMNRNGTTWEFPKKNDNKVTVEEIIGHLPSLESGEKSDIKWHFARTHTAENVLFMKHTPTGKTAFSNEVHYPKKKDGTRIIGYESSYRRIRWDVPSPTITIRNDCIASQRNVHPGRLLEDGTYSDARVLSPLELMLLNSLPSDWNIPDDTPEILIRQCIGESIPPLMVKEIVKMIGESDMSKKKAVSLFSSAGIAELLLGDAPIEVSVANELVPRRAECYSHFHPDSDMICGDIVDSETKKKIISKAKSVGATVLIATPPCQGLSTIGKNKKQAHYENDKRNFLVLEVLDIIDECDFDYILIENVPKFLDMYFPYENEYLKLIDIFKSKYSAEYEIDGAVFNAKDYGVCQLRPRAIIRLYKKGLKWSLPEKEPEIPLSKAIGHLPSLEAGGDSGIPLHFAKNVNERSILALKHTPTGKSAIYNEIHYPKKQDGTRIRGQHNTYKRVSWDMPCPVRTTYSGSVSSHNNVHPGKLLDDGTYSDARVFTLLETYIISSIPETVRFPEWASETFVRTMIGEAIPPKLLTKILEGIGK